MEITFMVTSPVAIWDFDTIDAAGEVFRKTPHSQLFMVAVDPGHPETVARRELLDVKLETQEEYWS
jgi:hypothetical protein